MDSVINTKHFRTRTVPGQDTHLPEGDSEPLGEEFPYPSVRMVLRSRGADRYQERSVPYFLYGLLSCAWGNRHLYIHTLVMP